MAKWQMANGYGFDMANGKWLRHIEAIGHLPYQKIFKANNRVLDSISYHNHNDVVIGK
jgi:hypothetical protein